MFGPVPRSPSGRSPQLCRWWRSAGVAGSAGAPTPRGSCRGVHRRKREPVRGLLAGAPTCTQPLLAGCSVEACNLSLGIRGCGKKKRKLWLSLSLCLPSRRTIRCARKKNLAKKSQRRFEDRALKKYILKPSRVFHSFSLWQRSMLFQNHCVFHDHFFSTVSSVRVNLIRKI